MAEDISPEVRQHTVIDLCQDFGNNTTMHGMRRVMNSSSLWKRGIWSLMVMGGFGWAIFQLHEIIKDYYRYPVTTVTELKHEARTRFPAVTFCTLNPINKALLPNDTMDYLESLAMETEEFAYIAKKAYASVLADQIWNKQYTEDVLASCMFDVKPCSANDFVKSVDAEYGLCYTFASNNTDLMYTTKTGWRNGLIVELDTQHREYLPWSLKAGVKVVVHDRDEYPNLEDEGFLVGPGLAASIVLSKTVIQRLPSPYGTCISQDDAATRQLSMFPRKQYRYTEIVCRKSCYQTLLISNCGCCDWSLSCENSSLVRSCSDDDVTCVFDIGQNFSDDISACVDNCPFECDKTIFNTVISTALWPSDSHVEIFLKKLNNSIFQNISLEPIDNLTQFVRNNFLRLEVYFPTLNFQEIVTKPTYDWTMLLGNVGGQLGLWLGFSLLTAMELVEFIIDTVSLFLRKLCRTNLKVKPNDSSFREVTKM